MQRSLAGFQNGISGFAVKAAGLVTAFVGVQQSLAAFRSGLDTAGRLNDLSKTTGEAAGNLAMLERAFQNNGMAAERVGPAIQGMSQFIVDLQSGSPSATKAMEDLGLSMSDLAGKTQIERMAAFLEAISKIQDPAQRSAMAVDVFKKAGRDIIPLANDFRGSLSEARAELGSLIPILNESGASLDELGDKLTNSVGNKFQELAIGFAAGITGANDFVTALSRIDAAGLGQQLGDSLRVAFDAPAETAKAIGYTLLTGVKQAGNNLMNAFSTAVSFFQNLFSDGEYWSGIGQRVQAMFMESVNAFNKLLLSAVESALLKPLSNLPGILGDPFRAALETTQDIRASLESASEANAKNLAEGGAKIESAIERATANTEVITKDWFGVEQSAADAARHFLEAQQVSDEIRANSEKTAENFGKGSAALREALNEVRGFDLTPKAGPEQRPDWTQSTAPPPAPAPTPDAPTATGGGSNFATRPTTALDALRQAAGTDARARADLFRIDAEKSRRTSRVSELMNKGFFTSAAKAEIRAERNAEKRAQDLMERRSLTDKLFNKDSSLKSMGELKNKFENTTPFKDRFGKPDAFEKFKKDAVKTESERKRDDEEKQRRDAPAGGGADKALATEASMQKLIAEITKRLPQVALG